MYRILSVEDNPEDEATLQAHVKRYATENNLDLQVTWQQSAFAIAAADGARYDLIFLDIELPGINGMEAAEALRGFDEETPVIFVTNLANYAIRGYEVDALGFVVKPVRYYDFRLRMDKAMRTLARNAGFSVTIPVEGGFRVTSARDLVYVEVSNHNLAYNLISGETLSARGTLSKLKKDLAESSFVRISNSCLANMAHIQTIRGNDLCMADGSTIYFSRSRKKPAMETIARYLGGNL